MSKQLKPIEQLRSSITALKPEIKAALPAHISVDKFNRVLMTAISSTKDLQEADRNSLFASCLKLAQQGLMPDGKEAAIVTFKNKAGGKTAQAMPMISGILKLVRNSGELASLSPHVVCENDAFDYWIDETGEHLQHRPYLEGDRGEITHAYAMAKTKDGAVYIEVMSKGELDKVRASSRAGKYGPWVDWYGEMAKKTVIRRLAKRLPMSTDLDNAITTDDAMYEDVTPEPTPEAETQPVKDVKPSKPKTSKKLAEVIEAQAEAVEEEPPAPTEKDAPAAEVPETPI